jgi:hypothetical protein
MISAGLPLALATDFGSTPSEYELCSSYSLYKKMK